MQSLSGVISELCTSEPGALQQVLAALLGHLLMELTDRWGSGLGEEFRPGQGFGAGFKEVRGST